MKGSKSSLTWLKLIEWQCLPPTLSWGSPAFKRHSLCLNWNLILKSSCLKRKIVSKWYTGNSFLIVFLQGDMLCVWVCKCKCVCKCLCVCVCVCVCVNVCDGRDRAQGLACDGLVLNYLTAPQPLTSLFLGLVRMAHKLTISWWLLAVSLNYFYFSYDLLSTVLSTVVLTLTPRSTNRKGVLVDGNGEVHRKRMFVYPVLQILGIAYSPPKAGPQ